MMGKEIIGSVVAGVLTVSAVGRAELLLSYNFNEGAGTSAVNSGSVANGNASMLVGSTATDLHGAAGSGVSGLAGDYALDLSRSDAMGNQSTVNNNAAMRLNNPAIQNMTSFTLTCWMKTDGSEVISNGARLFNYVDGSNNGFFVVGSGTTGYVTTTIDSAYFGNSNSTAYAAANTWIFFAVSYDGTKSTNNLTCYKGALDGGLTAVGTASLAAGTVNTNMLATPILWIGNSGTSGGTLGRPFDGWLDNVAIYGSMTDASGALNQTELRDVMAAAIPEPATIALMVAGMVGMRRGFKK